jgi:cAMP-dependent protein kinase regulator
LLTLLDRAGIRSVIEVLELVAADAGSTVIEQGAPGAEAFILARGEVEVWRRPRGSQPPTEQVLARLGVGALFGEMALLSGAPRAAMVTARRPALLLRARKEVLNNVVARQPEVGSAFAGFCHQRMVKNLLRISPLLGAVPPPERAALVNRFEMRSFQEDEALIVQGKEPEGLHLIASGEVVVMHRTDSEATVIAHLGVGEVVGEVSLVLRRPAGAHVVAVQPTVTLHLPHERFLDVIDQHPAVLKELYALAVRREEQTHSIVARPSSELEDVVLI